MQRWPRFLAKGNDFSIGFFAFAIDPGRFPVPFTLRNDVANGVVREVDHEIDPSMKGVAGGGTSIGSIAKSAPSGFSIPPTAISG